MNIRLCSAGYKTVTTPPEGVSVFQKDKAGESERLGVCQLNWSHFIGKTMAPKTTSISSHPAYISSAKMGHKARHFGKVNIWTMYSATLGETGILLVTIKRRMDVKKVSAFQPWEGMIARVHGDFPRVLEICFQFDFHLSNPSKSGLP